MGAVLGNKGTSITAWDYKALIRLILYRDVFVARNRDPPIDWGLYRKSMTPSGSTIFWDTRLTVAGRLAVLRL